MKKRRALILIIILLVIILGIVGVVVFNAHNKKAAFTIDVKDIYAISFTDKNHNQLEFNYIDGNWIFENEKEVVCNEANINKVLKFLSNISYKEYYTNYEELSLDFSEPDIIYTISDGDNNTTEIDISTKFEKDNKYYFVINQDYRIIYCTNKKIIDISKKSLEDIIN